MRPIPILMFLLLGGAAVGWAVTAPKRLPAAVTSGLTGDAGHGEQVFIAAGCASCHMAPGAKGGAEKVLTGGQRFETQFGTFVAPNISPSDAGIGGWSLQQFADAVMRGVSPDGQHYYPAFPYPAYANMKAQDVADLKAFMDTLPADDTASGPHEVSFPFNIRRSLGGWKLLFQHDGWVMDGDLSDEDERGRYLVEALAHCGECHTPRNAFGGLEVSRWLAGGPDATGRGTIPNITPAKLTWSGDEVVEYLTSGFTPDYDSAGGHMAHVVENMARLPESDRQAVAAYLAKVPPSE